MVGEKVQPVRAFVSLHAVNFDPFVVVNIRILVLRNCEKSVVVEEVHVVDFFLELELRAHVSTLAVEHRHVTFLPAEQHESVGGGGWWEVVEGGG